MSAQLSRPPLPTDQDRWRRVIFDSRVMVYQRMADSFGYRGVKVDTFTEPGTDRLVVDGEFNGHLLDRVDINSLTLVNRGFHWVQEQPYNR